ncbi:MAG: CPBP family intramembrane glutamic endopeptidase [Chloroflexota bacterium]
MINSPRSPSRTPVFPFWAALVCTLLMGVVYTVHDVLQVAEPLFSLLSFLPGALSLAALFLAGFSKEQCSLRFAWPSKAGWLALAGVCILLLPILLSSRGVTGWSWLSALVYAPASGLAQELYFRGALLPALARLFRPRLRLALGLHALLFIAYHLRTFRSIGALAPSLVVAGVLFLAGLGWGWQAQKDRTLAWTALQHSIFLSAMSVFTWG